MNLQIRWWLLSASRFLFGTYPSAELDLEGHGFTQLKCRDWNANKNYLLEWKITGELFQDTPKSPDQKSQKKKNKKKNDHFTHQQITTSPPTDPTHTTPAWSLSACGRNPLTSMSHQSQCNEQHNLQNKVLARKDLKEENPQGSTSFWRLLKKGASFLKYFSSKY